MRDPGNEVDIIDSNIPHLLENIIKFNSVTRTAIGWPGACNTVTWRVTDVTRLESNNNQMQFLCSRWSSDKAFSLLTIILNAITRPRACHFFYLSENKLRFCARHAWCIQLQISHSHNYTHCYKTGVSVFCPRISHEKRLVTGTTAVCTLHACCIQFDGRPHVPYAL